MKFSGHILAVLALLVANPCQSAETITIAVAANFSRPMQEIVTAFTEQTGHKVALAFGSSGKFYAQIKQGAPFMAFFSADQAKPALLEQQGLIVKGSRFTYALGALALWSRRADLVDPNGVILKSQQFNKLALANPKLAPYGQAAREVLESMGLDKVTRAKWVVGENVSQTYQFIASGNAELGFVAVSQLNIKSGNPKGSVWLIPGELHQPIRQDAVLLKNANHSEASKQLMVFIRSSKAQAILQNYGYQGGEHGLKP